MSCGGQASGRCLPIIQLADVGHPLARSLALGKGQNPLNDGQTKQAAHSDSHSCLGAILYMYKAAGGGGGGTNVPEYFCPRIIPRKVATMF